MSNLQPSIVDVLMREIFRANRFRRTALRDFRAEGDRARDARRWREAAALYGQHVDRQPDDFGIWVQLGHAWKEAGDFDRADNAYRAALGLDASDADLLLNYARLKLLRGDRSAATDLFRRSIQHGNRQEALTELRQAEGDDPFVVPDGKTVLSQDRVYFDMTYYRKRLGDIGFAFSPESSLEQVFQDRALHEFESPNPLIDPGFYLKRYEDVRRGGMNPAFHFMHFGDPEARQPGPLFDSAFYVARYPESAAEGPLRHYLLRNGQGVDPTPWFDSAFYAAETSTDIHSYRAFLAALPRLDTCPNPLFKEFRLRAGAVAQASRKQDRGLDIIIPHFESLLCAALSKESLDWLAAEHTGQDIRIILIDDSPHRPELSDVLAATVDILKASFAVLLISNEQTLGFIGSTNAGLKRAVQDGRDALLLNSDAYLTPGALTEMREVLQEDPMIAFVTPRSNNATLATWPCEQADSAGWTYADFYEAHQAAIPHFDRFTFVPVGVGFSLLIRWEVIAEFGLLDESYGRGYFEENDLIMRAGRCGYRACLANRAYCFHIGSASFGSLLSAAPADNESLFLRRYPEFQVLVKDYFASPARMYDIVLAGAANRSPAGRVLDKPRLVVDLSGLRSFHNGSFLAATALVRAGAEVWTRTFDVTVVAPRSAIEFHKLEGLDDRVHFIEEGSKIRGTVVLKLFQPFSANEIHHVTAYAPATCYFLLDTIAQDCGHLFRSKIDEIWNFVAASSDGLIFQSEFTRDQFLRRYAIGHRTRHIVSRHSLQLSDYGTPVPPRPDGHVLIVGNHFAHKFVGPTLRALGSALPDREIVALWDQTLDLGSRRIFKSGEISDGEMTALEEGAALFVFPSHYEGFGFPAFRGLALGKKVVARASRLTDEMSARAGGLPGLFTFRTADEMVSAVKRCLDEGVAAPVAQPKVHDWTDSALEISDFLKGLAETFEPALTQSRFRALSQIA